MTRAAALAACYSAATLYLTWPLAAHVGTHFGHPFDAIAFDTLRLAWSLAWETHALTTAPSTLLEGNIFHPTAHALAYGQMAFGMLPYFAPVQIVTGNSVLALNFAWLGSIVLTCCALHWVVRRLTGSDAAGAIAAAGFLGTRWLLWDFGAFAQNYAVVQYLPIILFLVIRPPERRVGQIALAALIALQALSDIYIAASMLLVLGLLIVCGSVFEATRRDAVRLIPIVTLAGILSLAAYAPHVPVVLDNPGLSSQTYFLPGTVVDSWIFSRARGPVALPPVLLGLIVVGSAAWWRRRRSVEEAHAEGAATPGDPIVTWSRTLAFTAAGLLVASPELHRWLGVDGLPGRNSAFVRLGTSAWIGLCVLSGLSFAECAAWLAKRGLARRGASAALLIALLVAIYLDYAYSVGRPTLLMGREPDVLAREYPLMLAPQLPERLSRVLRQSGGPVLEVGSGWSLDQYQNARAMFHSISHWSPILNGYGSYYPEDFPGRVRLVSGPPERASIEALHESTGVEWLLVMTAEVWPAHASKWREVATRGAALGLRFVAEDSGMLLFRVDLAR